MFLGSVPGEQFGVDGKQMQVRDLDVSWQLGKNQNVAHSDMDNIHHLKCMTVHSVLCTL